MKTKKVIVNVGIAVILSVLLFPGRTFGWGNTWMGISLKQIVDTARGKMGPFRYNTAFQVGNAGYYSDIYYGNTLDLVPDYTFTAGPQLSLFLPLKNVIVFDISEIPQYVFYLHTERERVLNNIFRGRMHFVLEKLYFQIGGGLSTSKQRMSTEVYINARSKMNDLEGLAFWQISKESAIALQYRFSTLRYENPEEGEFNQGILNRNENYINITASLQGTTRTRFFLDAEYGSFVFTEAISSFKDSRSYGIYGGIEFLPPTAGSEQSRGIQGSFNLGYKRFDILDPEHKDYKGLVGNTNIMLNIFKLTTLSGAFIRDVQFSVYSGIGYYIQSVYMAGISRDLTKRINISYSLTFNQYDYVEPEVGGIDGARIESINHNFGIGLRLKDNLSLNLMSSLGERNSDFFEQINHRFFIGFNLSYGRFPGNITMPRSPLSR